MTLEATVSPSESIEKVLSAATNIIGEAPSITNASLTKVRVESASSKSLERLHNQLRDRRVRGAARRRFLSGRSGEKSVVMLNRQAANAGVLALCDSEQESPLGPIYLTIESKVLDELIDWLTDFPRDNQPPV